MSEGRRKLAAPLVTTRAPPLRIGAEPDAAPGRGMCEVDHAL